MKKIIPLLIAVLSFSKGYSLTYTATTSGNWSDMATWSGAVPPQSISLDQISIPAGITVSVNSNVTINGIAALLHVDGSLVSALNTDTLWLGAGTLDGHGSIGMGSVTLDTSALLAFAGNITANNFTSAALAINDSAGITVNQTLRLTYGILTLSTGGALTLANNATVEISGGAFNVLGGAVNLVNPYNVVYTGTSTTTGVETTGAGLENVTINLPQDSSTVTLNSDLNVTGTLYLTHGTLVLNAYNLVLIGNVNGAAGMIRSTSASSVTIVTPGSPTGILRFTSDGNTVKNLNINVNGFNAVATLGSDLTVTGILNFVSGSLETGDYTLTLAQGATVAGANASSYVITGDSGAVAMAITAGDSTYTQYPIGTSTHFSPAAVEIPAGAASGMVAIGVMDSVRANGTTGPAISINQPVVNATWRVSSDISSNLNLNLALGWTTAMEINGFDHDSAYISHYTGGAWDSVAIGSANASSGASYAIVREGITSLSPFAVFGKHVNPVVTNVLNLDDATIGIYPNPASDNLFIEGNVDNISKVEITDLQGRLVKQYTAPAEQQLNIQLAGLNAGNYLVKLYAGDLKTVKRFVKM